MMILVTISLSQLELAELSKGELPPDIAERIRAAVKQQTGRRAEIQSAVAELQAVAARRAQP